MNAASHFSIHLSEEVVHGNMLIFKNCAPGEKLLMNKETGALQVDDRRMQWVQRAVFGAFGTDVVEHTLARSVEIIKSAAVDGKRARKSSLAYKIHSIYLEAVQGVRKLAETYRGEGKEIAGKLDAIAANYFNLFTSLPDLQKQSSAKKKMTGGISFRTHAVPARPGSGHAVEMKSLSSTITEAEEPAASHRDFSESGHVKELSIEIPAVNTTGTGGKDPLIPLTEWGPHTNEPTDHSEEKIHKRKGGFFQRLFSCCCIK